MPPHRSPPPVHCCLHCWSKPLPPLNPPFSFSRPPLYPFLVPPNTHGVTPSCTAGGAVAIPLLVQTPPSCLSLPLSPLPALYIPQATVGVMLPANVEEVSGAGGRDAALSSVLLDATTTHAAFPFSWLFPLAKALNCARCFVSAVAFLDEKGAQLKSVLAQKGRELWWVGKEGQDGQEGREAVDGRRVEATDGATRVATDGDGTASVDDENETNRLAMPERAATAEARGEAAMAVLSGMFMREGQARINPDAICPCALTLASPPSLSLKCPHSPSPLALPSTSPRIFPFSTLIHTSSLIIASLPCLEPPPLTGECRGNSGWQRGSGAHSLLNNVLAAAQQARELWQEGQEGRAWYWHWQYHALMSARISASGSWSVHWHHRCTDARTQAAHERSGGGREGEAAAARGEGRAAVAGRQGRAGKAGSRGAKRVGRAGAGGVAVPGGADGAGSGWCMSGGAVRAVCWQRWNG
ncbi:unnamed protein product [Closterium sp. Yama58-4]|nr:unnamed protein product [Closterium sp. Yama58-4]